MALTRAAARAVVANGAVLQDGVNQNVAKGLLPFLVAAKDQRKRRGRR